MLFGFHWNQKFRSYRKKIKKNFKIPKTVELPTLSSIAFVKVQKKPTEHQMKWNKWKKSEIGTFYDNVHGRHQSVFPFCLGYRVKISASIWLSPKIWIQNPQKWKKMSANGHHHSNLYLKRSPNLKWQPSRTKWS